MFDFFRKKKKNINTKEINTFNQVLKVISDFIDYEEFDKAYLAIKEIQAKENKAFQLYIENVPEKERKKELEVFKKKIDKLLVLKEKLDKKKLKYLEKQRNAKKKNDTKFFLEKLDQLCGKNNFSDAILLLNQFLDNHKDDLDVIDLINKQKKVINTKIEKFKKKKEKEIKNDTLKEAQSLIGEIKILNHKEDQNVEENLGFFAKIKSSLTYYKNMKKRMYEKRLFDEVNMLLESKKEKDESLVKNKLASIHSGNTKEISEVKVNGYDIYAKIISADKISGDSIGFNKNKMFNNKFFIGDATGHGIKAWFTITKLTKKFNEIANKYSLEKLVFEVNNYLKEELNSGNFITSIFFNINDNQKNTLEFIGMWHEPMFLYRAATHTTEKIIPGWLAAGIRIMKDLEHIKKKSIEMNDGDVLIAYSDGIVEARSLSQEPYSIERLGKKFEEYARNKKLSSKDIYKYLIDDLRLFTGWKTNYLDDVTLLVIKRDQNKEVFENKEEIVKLLKKEGLDSWNSKKLQWKSFDEIRDEILRMQREQSLKNILSYLDGLYRTGEIVKLKQECIRYIKEGYIHKNINFLLKKSIDSENDFKISQKNKKMSDKYEILKELYKKWDYETVISECSAIISKDGNI